MSVTLTHMRDGLPLHPFPEGWYFVASRADLRKRKLIHKTWLGEEIVAWSDEQGRVCVADAVCPHLGSSLAPDVGTRVCEGRLVCPFHGFEYDTTGRCVATPYALPPKSARLNMYATREIEGMVFGWWGIRCRPPQWELPEVPQQSPQLGSARGNPSHENSFQPGCAWGNPSHAKSLQPGSARGNTSHTNSGWTGLRFHTLRFRGHPQETTENSVDLAHLRYVHGYESVSRVGEIRIDGAYLRGSFKFKARIGVSRLLSTTFDVSAVAHIFGLGYSQVDFEEHSTGYRSRLWILSTPIDGTTVAMTIASQVGGMERPKGVAFGLRLLPLSVRLHLMNRLTLRMETGYVKEDLVIWSRKRYLTHPRLNGADGEILAYRRYCEQFYGDRDEDRAGMGGRLIARQV